MKTKRWIPAFVLISLVLALLPSLAYADFGSNWTAEYYDNENLSGSPVQIDNGINGVNFNWGSGKPISKVDSDKFSIRYSSTQTFGQGTYEFLLSSDDGARVFIDGNLVLDRFVSRPLTTDRFQQTLTAGDHSLKVEYFENKDNASIQFQWFLVSAATPVVILTPGLIGSVATPIPGPAATIAPSGPQASLTFVRGLALRTGPYLGATMITTLTRDTSYNVLGRNRSEGIYNWYLIQMSDGRQGWASGRYLDLNVEVNSVPEVGSVFDTFNDAPDIGARAIPRAVMILRKGPSVRAEAIGKIGYGEVVELIGRTVQANTNQWYQVRRGSTGEVGWIYAPWVTVKGEINQVPIR